MSVLRNAAEMDEALETGEDSLLSRLQQRLPGGLDRPWALTASFKAMGHGFEQVLREEGHLLVPDAYRALCQKIARAIYERHTTAAVGYLRVRLYQAGESQEAKVEFGRNIAPAGTSEEAPMSWLREQNGMVQARCASLEVQLKEAYALIATFATNAHNQLVNVATVRAPVTAAGDLQSLWSVIAVAVLAVGGPHLVRMLRLDGSTDVRKAIELRLREAFGTLPPPPGAGTAQGASENESPGATTRSAPQEIADWVEGATDDELGQLANVVRARPSLLLKLASLA